MGERTSGGAGRVLRLGVDGDRPPRSLGEGGDDVVAASKGTPMQHRQHPILLVHEGGGDSRPVSGAEALAEVAAVLEERLPLIAALDPARPALQDLQDALRAMQLSPALRRGAR